MTSRENLIKQIKNVMARTEPTASLVLYGSYARGDFDENSDIDLLILLDEENISRAEQKRIKYPLYDIEFETGTIISPMIFSKKDWKTKHRKTPFYENIQREGLAL